MYKYILVARNAVHAYLNQAARNVVHAYLNQTPPLRKKMAVHEVFEVRPLFKENHHQFLTVLSAPEVSREIVQRLLDITDGELGAHLIEKHIDGRRAIAMEDWLRYKATMLRKVLCRPGDFSFLKYSRHPPVPYWLLNVMYQAVEMLDAWTLLRTTLGSEPGMLLSQTPTIEQLEKIINSAGVFYTSDEFSFALKTMFYISKNGWSLYVWRNSLHKISRAF